MSNTKLFADDLKVYKVLRDTKQDVDKYRKILLEWNLGAMRLAAEI